MLRTHSKPKVPFFGKLEGVSIGFRNIKTKLINLANHKGDGKSSEPIKLDVIAYGRYKARENEYKYERVVIGFVFTSDQIQ